MATQSLLPILRKIPINMSPLVCPLLQLRFMSSPKPKFFLRNKDKVDRQKVLRELKRNRLTEYKHQLQDEAKKVHCMRIAFKGEALDPEALNPARKRPPHAYTEEELEKHALLMKQWSAYKNRQWAKMNRELTALRDSRLRTMRELKKVSPFHFNEALKPAIEFPIEIAPIPEFPPIEGYEPPEPHDQLFPENKKKQKK